MPKRFLKPGINSSIRYNSCSDAARDVFVRLISEVDDFARFDADPAELAGVLFPVGKPIGRMVRADRMQDWLNELEKNRLLILYQSGGKPYLHLLRWTERVRKEVQSRFPMPPADSCDCFPCILSQQATALASSCQQLPANAVNGCQIPSNAASQSPSPSPSPSPSCNKNGASLLESRTQYAALRARVIEAARRDRIGELDVVGREILEKMRGALKIVQKKQARGDFSLMDLKEVGL